MTEFVGKNIHVHVSINRKIFDNLICFFFIDVFLIHSFFSIPIKSNLMTFVVKPIRWVVI